MEQGIFSYIWRHSKPDQILILVATVASFPFLYMALNLPKSSSTTPSTARTSQGRS